MTRTFITADAAHILSKNSRTYESLLIEAERAILETTRKAKRMGVSIDFTGVDDETWRKVNDFLVERGFKVNLYNVDTNGFEKMLRISWF